jgi:NAD(P)-dependent dehydrogenase (short-subunit alcohol dehydrogenase family)
VRLEAKTVLVKGAAGGVGYAVAELFASEGAMVFASDVMPPKHACRDGIEALHLDVASQSEWLAVVSAGEEVGGDHEVACCEPLGELAEDRAQHHARIIHLRSSVPEGSEIVRGTQSPG